MLMLGIQREGTSCEHKCGTTGPRIVSVCFDMLEYVIVVARARGSSAAARHQWFP